MFSLLFKSPTPISNGGGVVSSPIRGISHFRQRRLAALFPWLFLQLIISFLLTNVVHYCIFVNIANCYYIVASFPKVSTTVFSSELRMSVKQHKGTFAFSSKEQQRFADEKDSNRQSLLERTK